VQSLVRERLKGRGSAFSREFAALAGSWEDERAVEEIIRDIEASRTSARRAGLQ
jgi:hypothetical protein